uniref:Uncharacterized protein n=1 Tax=Leersia perrieri TaxID=77586 RepID=A0A0D9XIV8_9ORYZ
MGAWIRGHCEVNCQWALAGGFTGLFVPLPSCSKKSTAIAGGMVAAAASHGWKAARRATILDKKPIKGKMERLEKVYRVTVVKTVDRVK